VFLALETEVFISLHAVTQSVATSEDTMKLISPELTRRQRP